MIELQDANKRIRVNTQGFATNKCEDLEQCYRLVDVSTGEIVFEGDYNTCMDIGFFLKKYVNMPLWVWR